jgi:hypothetical protein
MITQFPERNFDLEDAIKLLGHNYASLAISQTGLETFVQFLRQSGHQERYICGL